MRMLDIADPGPTSYSPPTGLGMAQEREFYKYCQLPQRPGLLHRPPISPRREENKQLIPESSDDITLTALAQLGALRLNAQRCMISLFDRHSQYILAEATRTLSLQDDRVHEEGDALWLGSSVIAKSDGICHYVCDESRLNVSRTDCGAPSTAACALVIPDLTKDDRFNQRHYVVKAPHLRFYAGVPIMTRRGIVIGAFAVSDGEPRAGLDPLEVRFMTDTAAAIMNHLDMARAHDQNRRGANMIAGLGSFVDGGKLPSSSRRGGRRRGKNRDHREGEEKEREVEREKGHDGSGPRVAIREYEMKPGLSEKPNETRVSRSSTQSQTESNGNTKPEATLKTGTRDIFSRAARVLQESLEVEGVVFFDARVNSYAALVRNADDRASDTETSSYTSSETTSSSDSENSGSGYSSIGADDGTTCEVLGVALDEQEQPTGAMREVFLRSLLRHYPRGAIFNIDENGSVSSSEGSDSASNSSVSREIVYRRHEGSKVERYWKQRKRNRLSLKEENNTLIKVFPSARCVTMFPLWDSHHDHWFSGLFLWTKSPRVFSLSGELAYLYAFSNSIMAEIHRLDIELANRAHATLVGSISHELRSPLHGILGSTELLVDSSMSPAQVALVNTIEHCGRSLLDIINNMLDFAKINQFTRKSRSSRSKFPLRIRRRPPPPDRTPSHEKPTSNGVVNLISDVQLDSVLEEVADSVFAGHCFAAKPDSLAARGTSIVVDAAGESRPLLKAGTGGTLSALNEALTVIYDVDPGVNWLFETQPGAWRRILMNLFGNSLKYTHSGYILISLKSSTPTAPAANKARRLSRSEGDRDEIVSVTLTVKDSGQGIEKGYLQSNVFKPFSQENPLSPGSGLGLSIVHQTVLSLGGKVDVASTKGAGTDVTICVDLPRIPKTELTGNRPDIGILDRTKKVWRGKSIGLIGFDAATGEDGVALALLRKSLIRMYEDHFGLKVGLVPSDTGSQSPSALTYDMYVVRHSKDDEAVFSLGKYISQLETRKQIPPMIVVCSSPQVAQGLATKASYQATASIYEFISQPCGPCKMAAALMACAARQKTRGLSTTTTATIQEESGSLQTVFLAASHATQQMQSGENISRVDLSLTPNKATVSVTTGAAGDSKMEVSTVEATMVVPSILLVDDNEVNLKLLVAFMKKAKFPFFTACNGLEALETYKAHFPQIQVVLMDISMPVMDGLESTRHIRLFEKGHLESSSTSGPSHFKPATIIALSGLGSEPVRQEAYTSGVDLFLSKPVRFHELIKQINTLMR